jgi:hypothetical protein
MEYRSIIETAAVNALHAVYIHTVSVETGVR